MTDYNTFQIPTVRAKMQRIDLGEMTQVLSCSDAFDSHVWLIMLHHHPERADLCTWVKFTEYDLMYVCSLSFLKLDSNDYKRLAVYNPKLLENVFDEDSRDTSHDGAL